MKICSKRTKCCRRSKQHKRGTILFEIALGVNLCKLAKELTDKTYKLGKYRVFEIYDPKRRLIEALPYKDRVVLMCFCRNVLEPVLERRLIYDNAASRIGKGTDFAITRLHGFMRRMFINGGREGYVLKCDIAKYFQNINAVLSIAICFLNQVIRSHPEQGLPLGNQTSQWFALLYLDEVDRLIKEKLRAPYYIRYMDDFVLLSESKEFLQKCRAEIQKVCAEKLKLSLNNKTQIGKIKNGVDFLGFNHKLTVSGKIVKSLRASAKIRQRQYLKTMAHYYRCGVLDEEYLNVRLNAYKAHLAGTGSFKFIRNKIQTLISSVKKMSGKSSFFSHK